MGRRDNQRLRFHLSRMFDQRMPNNDGALVQNAEANSALAVVRHQPPTTDQNRQNPYNRELFGKQVVDHLASNQSVT